MLDHPVITNMERTGYPDGKEPDPILCPLCGGECETIYRRKEDLSCRTGINASDGKI
jgi:hypothetical protein